MAGRHTTSIIKYPTGKYGFVGSIPESLTVQKGGLYPQRASMIFETEAEAKRALKKASVKGL